MHSVRRLICANGTCAVACSVRFLPVLFTARHQGHPFEHSSGRRRDRSGWRRQLTVRTTVNARIREFATTTPDVVFWDVAAAYDDGTGRPISGYTVDGLHPSPLGSQH